MIAAWHFGSGTLFDPFFVGDPIGVATALFGDLRDPRFWNDLRVTGTEMTLGYLLGGVSGISRAAFCSPAGGLLRTSLILSSLA